MGFSQRFLCLFGGGKPYYKTVLGYGPIAYWPLWETAGTTAQCLVNAAQNGTYARDVSVMGTGDGIGDGNSAPEFDGTNDYVNIYSVALNAAFDGREGALVVWARVSGAGVWTDGAFRYLIRLLANADNYITLIRHVNNNRLDRIYVAGGTIESYSHSPFSPTMWMGFGMQWSAAADEVRWYYNGAWLETDTVLGAWAGNLSNVGCNIGSNLNPPANLWSGTLAHVALYDYPPGDDVMERLTSPL